VYRRRPWGDHHDWRTWNRLVAVGARRRPLSPCAKAVAQVLTDRVRREQENPVRGGRVSLGREAGQYRGSLTGGLPRRRPGSTTYNPRTVSRALAELLAAGIVAKLEPDRPRRGSRRVMEYVIAPGISREFAAKAQAGKGVSAQTRGIDTPKSSVLRTSSQAAPSFARGAAAPAGAEAVSAHADEFPAPHPATARPAGEAPRPLLDDSATEEPEGGWVMPAGFDRRIWLLMGPPGWSRVMQEDRERGRDAFWREGGREP
jgi:hypothetical protein